MKTLPKLIVNGLLTCMGTLGAVFCLTTAFSISVSVPPILLAAVLLSFLFSICFTYKKAMWTLIPIAAFLVLLSFFTGFFSLLGPTLTQLLHDILSRFSSAYPNLSFFIPAAPDPIYPQSNTALFCAMAILLSLWQAWGVGYRSCLISVAGILPFLLLCVVINDTPPQALPLIMVLVTWVTVLMAKERPGEPASMSATRAILTLASVLLVLGVIGVAYPKDDTRTQELPELVQSFLDRLPGPMQNMLSRDSNGISSQELGADTSRILDLTQQGTRDRKDTVMMEVSTTEVGPLYLRGAAKDIYTGTSWESSDEASSAESVYAHTSLGTAFGTDQQAAVQIKNLHDKATVLFAPYGFISCTSAEPIMSDLRMDIYESDYTVYYWPGVRTLDISTATGYSSSDYDSYVMEHCLELPEDTKTALYELAVSYGYDPEMSTAQTIAWVAEFIRSSGEYKLNVSRQPVNFDFAYYFLTESKAGYCVHFATAAATMFRALGIPSRYASGYRVTVTESSAVTEATDQDTHAWAEVYLSGLGWIPVETTPGFGETSMLPQVEQEIPPEPTAAAPSPSPSPSMVPASPSPSPNGGGAGQAMPSPSPSPDAQQENPSGTSGSSGTAGSSARASWYLLLIPGVLLLFILVLLIRRLIVLHSRKKAFAVSNSNQAVLNLWQYASRLSLWGAELPQALEELALKAKFSRHTITTEELQGFRASVFSIAEHVQGQLTWWKRLRFKYLSVLDHRK